MCPFCGDNKEVLNLICADGYIKELWSDMRCIRPHMPQFFPIRKCGHCGKYYFIKESQYIYVDIDAVVETLTYEQLKEAKAQFKAVSLTGWENERLQLELLKSYNEKFPSNSSESTETPTEEDARLYKETIEWLLQESDEVRNNPMLRGELLREAGRFLNAIILLALITREDVQWIVKPMYYQACKHDSLPCLLIKDNKPLYDNDGVIQ